MNQTSEARADFARPAPPLLEQGIVPSGHPLDIDRAAPQSSCRPRCAPPVRGRERLAVITCYFNPCGYRSLRRNYQRFAQDMQDQQAAFFTIELAHRDHAFLFEPSESVMQVRASDVMWQKERLLNVLIQRLPDQFDQVAWVDADVRFENPNWRGDASLALDETPIVQLFEEAAMLDAEGHVSDVRRGVAHAVSNQLPNAANFGYSHPGFAWAARRELLDRHGLLDHHVTGGGDSLMAIAMYGWWNHPLLRCYGRAMREAFLAWAEPLFADVRGRVGCVPGRLRHFWHGSRQHRQYVERTRWLLQYGFDPRADLGLNPSGTWSWTTAKPELHAQIERYFSTRREDGT